MDRSFSHPDSVLVGLLQKREAAIHPLIPGELAMGSSCDRRKTVALLVGMPSIQAASNGDVLAMIKREAFFGKGLSFVDVHLLAEVLGAEGSALRTCDKRLRLAADHLGLSVPLPPLH